MKVILENFGPIKRVEFDLTKDLNVIFGKNNIGKSYSITALYIILKHLLAEFGGSTDLHIQRLQRGQGFYSSSKPFSIGAEASLTLQKIIEKVRTIFDKEPELQEYDLTNLLGQLLCNTVLASADSDLTNALNNSFQSVKQLSNHLSGRPIAITIISSQATLHYGVVSDALVLIGLRLHQPVVVRKHEHQNLISHEDKQTVLYFKAIASTRVDELADLELLLVTVESFLVQFRQELRTVAQYIYFLPASRSGLYQALNSLSALLADLSRNRTFTTKGFSLPSFSEPVADYFLQLSTIKPEVEPGEVSVIARQIEAEILGGEVGFNTQTNKLFFRQNSIGRNGEMDLATTSSMVSEIAPIVAYFKYILRYELTTESHSFLEAVEQKPAIRRIPPSLLFIEEPEAHLHPEVQVKLMEFFARLTKHNVKVVMTSHSNYMFNKLSNLLLTGELEPHKVGSYLLRATPEGSMMDPFAMRAEEEGIADENFVDVAEQLYNERLAAYDKLNAK